MEEPLQKEILLLQSLLPAAKQKEPHQVRVQVRGIPLKASHHITSVIFFPRWCKLFAFWCVLVQIFYGTGWGIAHMPDCKKVCDHGLCKGPVENSHQQGKKFAPKKTITIKFQTKKGTYEPLSHVNVDVGACTAPLGPNSHHSHGIMWKFAPIRTSWTSSRTNKILSKMP